MKKFRRFTNLIPIFQLMRLRQWVKNGAVYAALVFSGQLFIPELFLKSTVAFLAFSFLSSAHYVLNDIIDMPSDIRHPGKKNRPLARGSVTKKTAWITAIVSESIGLMISVSLGTNFLFYAFLFTILHILLIFVLRYIRIVDIIALAAGYVLRIIAGEAAIDGHISIWLSLSALCLSLLVAVGKRLFEERLAESSKRSIQFPYSQKVLESYLAMLATATFITYTYFSFLSTFGTEAISGVSTFSGRKWLMATVPFVLVAIMRYLQNMYVGVAQSYQQLIVKDRLLLLSSGLWVVSVFVVIYGIGR